MKVTRPDRRVVTFYSFKGGVGRTMAVANVAHRLADTHALDVIAVDWDLEAPGLHKFFGLTNEQMAGARGVLDYFLAWRDAIRDNAPAPPDVAPWLIRIEDKAHAPRHGSLSLLVAGRLDADYGKRLAAQNCDSCQSAQERRGCRSARPPKPALPRLARPRDSRWPRPPGSPRRAHPAQGCLLRPYHGEEATP